MRSSSSSSASKRTELPPIRNSVIDDLSMATQRDNAFTKARTKKANKRGRGRRAAGANTESTAPNGNSRMEEVVEEPQTGNLDFLGAAFFATEAANVPQVMVVNVPVGLLNGSSPTSFLDFHQNASVSNMVSEFIVFAASACDLAFVGWGGAKVYLSGHEGPNPNQRLFVEMVYEPITNPDTTPPLVGMRYWFVSSGDKKFTWADALLRKVIEDCELEKVGRKSKRSSENKDPVTLKRLIMLMCACVNYDEADQNALASAARSMFRPLPHYECEANPVNLLGPDTHVLLGDMTTAPIDERQMETYVQDDSLKFPVPDRVTEIPLVLLNRQGLSNSRPRRRIPLSLSAGMEMVSVSDEHMATVHAAITGREVSTDVSSGSMVEYRAAGVCEALNPTIEDNSNDVEVQLAERLSLMGIKLGNKAKRRALEAFLDNPDITLEGLRAFIAEYEGYTIPELESVMLRANPIAAPAEVATVKYFLSHKQARKGKTFIPQHLLFKNKDVTLDVDAQSILNLMDIFRGAGQTDHLDGLLRCLLLSLFGCRYTKDENEQVVLPGPPGVGKSHLLGVLQSLFCPGVAEIYTKQTQGSRLAGADNVGGIDIEHEAGSDLAQNNDRQTNGPSNAVAKAMSDPVKKIARAFVDPKSGHIGRHVVASLGRATRLAGTNAKIIEDEGTKQRINVMPMSHVADDGPSAEELSALKNTAQATKKVIALQRAHLIQVLVYMVFWGIDTDTFVLPGGIRREAAVTRMEYFKRCLRECGIDTSSKKYIRRLKSIYKMAEVLTVLLAVMRVYFNDSGELAHTKGFSLRAHWNAIKPYMFITEAVMNHCIVMSINNFDDGVRAKVGRALASLTKYSRNTQSGANGLSVSMIHSPPGAETTVRSTIACPPVKYVERNKTVPAPTQSDPNRQEEHREPDYSWILFKGTYAALIKSVQAEIKEKTGEEFSREQIGSVISQMRGQAIAHKPRTAHRVVDESADSSYSAPLKAGEIRGTVHIMAEMLDMFGKDDITDILLKKLSKMNHPGQGHYDTLLLCPIKGTHGYFPRIQVRPGNEIPELTFQNPAVNDDEEEDDDVYFDDSMFDVDVTDMTLSNHDKEPEGTELWNALRMFDVKSMPIEDDVDSLVQMVLLCSLGMDPMSSENLQKRRDESVARRMMYVYAQKKTQLMRKAGKPVNMDLMVEKARELLGQESTMGKPSALHDKFKETYPKPGLLKRFKAIARSTIAREMATEQMKVKINSNYKAAIHNSGTPDDGEYLNKDPWALAEEKTTKDAEKTKKRKAGLMLTSPRTKKFCSLTQAVPKHRASTPSLIGGGESSGTDEDEATPQRMDLCNAGTGGVVPDDFMDF